LPRIPAGSAGAGYGWLAPIGACLASVEAAQHLGDEMRKLTVGALNQQATSGGEALRAWLALQFGVANRRSAAGPPGITTTDQAVFDRAWRSASSGLLALHHRVEQRTGGRRAVSANRFPFPGPVRGFLAQAVLLQAW